MRLDYDLIRELLLEAEEITNGLTNYEFRHFKEKFPDIEDTVLAYHLKFLHDAGLIEGTRYIVVDITPRGREYLNNVRDTTAWRQIKEKLHPIKCISFSVLEEVAKAFTLSKLGL